VDHFQKVLDNAARLKKNRDETTYPLDYEAYNEFVDLREDEAEQFEGLYDEVIATLNMSNLEVDKAYINSDESRIARNDDWMEGVSKDFYLEETLYIMRDMIDLTKGESYTKK